MNPIINQTNSVKHICGCTEIHELCGTKQDCDRKAAWFATKQCKACWSKEKLKEQAVESARVRKLAIEQHFPMLSGSDKQIDWATRIRQKMFDSFETYVQVYSSGDVMQLARLREVFNLHILSNDDGNWFIDNRHLESKALLFKQLEEWAQGKQTNIEE